MSDRLLGGAMLVLALAYIWAALEIKTGQILDPLGPRSFPVLVGSVLAVASLYPLLRPDPKPEWPSLARFLDIVAAVVVLGVYALILEPLGFLIATALAVVVMSWRLGARPAAAVVTGIGVSLLIYTVIHLILGLSLPYGPLGF